MFAPRESKFTNSGYVPDVSHMIYPSDLRSNVTQLFLFPFYAQVYDHSIIPRIAISLVMMIFGIVASALLVGHYSEKIEVSMYSLSLQLANIKPYLLGHHKLIFNLIIY